MGAGGGGASKENDTTYIILEYEQTNAHLCPSYSPVLIARTVLTDSEVHQPLSSALEKLWSNARESLNVVSANMGWKGSRGRVEYVLRSPSC